MLPSEIFTFINRVLLNPEGALVYPVTSNSVGVDSDISNILSSSEFNP